MELISEVKKPSIGLKVLFEAEQPKSRSHIVAPELSAIHSGKLGDIIYALPACKALGIRHLIINVHSGAGDKLRRFSYQAARQLAPLLLAQRYLEKITITECELPLELASRQMQGVDFNFDFFRQVPRHRAGKLAHQSHLSFTRYQPDDVPAHLGEHFAAALGIQVDLKETWLNAGPSPQTRNALVVSITKNWRSFPDSYWRQLLAGLENIFFVGHRSEYLAAKIPGSKFIDSLDHLELASHIREASLFLGTISFPYALAEALKVRRAVEVCQFNLNAFPVGKYGYVLPPDLIAARRLVEKLLGEQAPPSYRLLTDKMVFKPKVWLMQARLRFDAKTTWANQTRWQTFNRWLRHHLTFFRNFQRPTSST